MVDPVAARWVVGGAYQRVALRAALSVHGLATVRVQGPAESGEARSPSGQVRNDTDRHRLISNIVAPLGGANKRSTLRQPALFDKVDADYGERVAQGLGVSLDDVKRLAAMSQEDRVKGTAA